VKSSSIYKLKEILKTLSNNEDKIQKAVWEIEGITREDRKYNGWVNYETWSVNLWLTNDQSMYNMAYECGDVQSLKELVENFVDGNNEECLLIPSMAQDLVNSALSECDFYEIFDHFENARKEAEEYEEE